MSLFKLAKYSSILFFLGKYKSKLFRIVAVLLFAGISSLLYGDVADYLQQAHPGVVIYALIAKILIVYGSLAFVLWQFRPEPEPKVTATLQEIEQGSGRKINTTVEPTPNGPLADLEDVAQKENLRSRYDGILKGNNEKPE